jgi:hypothetical protein
MIGGEIVPVALFMMIGATAIGVPIARAVARRIERQGGGGMDRLPSDVGDRLERMEQAIDAIAVEVERISEAQRFTTKLLTERAGGSPDQPQNRTAT